MSWSRFLSKRSFYRVHGIATHESVGLSVSVYLAVVSLSWSLIHHIFAKVTQISWCHNVLSKFFQVMTDNYYDIIKSKNCSCISWLVNCLSVCLSFFVCCCPTQEYFTYMETSQYADEGFLTCQHLLWHGTCPLQMTGKASRVYRGLNPRPSGYELNILPWSHDGSLSVLVNVSAYLTSCLHVYLSVMTNGLVLKRKFSWCLFFFVIDMCYIEWIKMKLWPSFLIFHSCITLIWQSWNALQVLFHYLRKNS